MEPDRDHPRPRRCLLIGTSACVSALEAQLGAAAPWCTTVGAVIVRADAAADRSPVASTVAAIPELGGLDRLCEAIRASTPDLAVVSLPMSMPGTIFEIRRQLREHALPERFVPPLAELLAATPDCDRSLIEPRTTRECSRPGRSGALEVPGAGGYGALIDREPRTLDRERVRSALCGRRVLVTGAGGSIGSELARLAAGFDPAELILIERSENALFEIDRQLERRYPGIPRRAVLHDVVDVRATRSRFGMLRPDVVFHAAAHKHVPLMEDHPVDAVRNNVFGTVSVVRAALEADAERFVLISSDKAVNPTSVMGATKRLAECCVQAVNRARSSERGEGTRLAMVRFGNVCGSAGSVIPVWSAQLAEGGPLTVTDARMTRYFMTIPEAATLVIQAAAMVPQDADHPPLYVLDMGEPVSILDLAQRFVRAHGFEPVICPDPARAEAAPGVMPIVLTGIRPGEKLNEQLAYDAEQLAPTDHPGIHAWCGHGAAGPWSDLDGVLNDLEKAADSGDRAAIIQTIRRYVPEMLCLDSVRDSMRRAG